MYPIGCNAINDRTIGESAQGLADYVKRAGRQQRPLSCAIAYDTRHRSRQFAELCSEIMAAAGFTVYFLDGYRSTPELSFAVRYKKCDCGIMITASHNPPTDNAVKVYWSSGGQYCRRTTPPRSRDAAGHLDQADAVCRGAGRRQGRLLPGGGRRRVHHGRAGPEHRPARAISKSSIRRCTAWARRPCVRCLDEAGFSDVEIFGPHAAPDGDFPNVPKHVANPENPAVFDAMIERAKQIGAELILATDPDCDRLGCAVRKSLAADAPWATLTGNQIGSLLTDFLLAAREGGRHAHARALRRQDAGHHRTDPPHRRPLRRADGRQSARRVQVDRRRNGRPRPGTFRLRRRGIVRIPGRRPRPRQGRRRGLAADGRVAARLKAEGKTLCQRLDELFRQYGCHTEGQINVQMPGEKGMDDMQALMAKFRTAPPRASAA